MAREGAGLNKPAPGPAPPLPLVYEGEGRFHVIPAFAAAAERRYGAGEIVTMLEHEERSSASHRHMFAIIREAWLNLPGHLVLFYPTPEALRKRCLIRAGYYNERSLVCASKAEARRVAAFLRPMDDMAVISISGKVVLELTAKSQSERAMGRAVFQQSKEAVLEALGELIGVDPTTLSKHAEAA